MCNNDIDCQIKGPVNTPFKPGAKEKTSNKCIFPQPVMEREREKEKDRGTEIILEREGKILMGRLYRRMKQIICNEFEQPLAVYSAYESPTLYSLINMIDLVR